MSEQTEISKTSETKAISVRLTIEEIDRLRNESGTNSVSEALKAVINEWHKQRMIISEAKLNLERSSEQIRRLQDEIERLHSRNKHDRIRDKAWTVLYSLGSLGVVVFIIFALSRMFLGFP